MHRNPLSLVIVAFLGVTLAVAACGGGAATEGQTTKTPCVFDPATQKLRECFHVTADGGCAHFGGDCPLPTDGTTPCLFDKDSNSFRECYHVTADGSCAHFGTPCTP